MVEEIARALATGVTGFTTHSDIVAPYLLNFGTEDQKLRHLPAMARGDTVASLAITEPGAGSDVKAIRSTAARVDGGYLLNGQKTFITNGFHADRVLVAAKTDPAAGARGISLFWVDAATPGFTRGRLLDKVGQRAQDTAELFFQDVLVPDADLLGEPGQGFGYMMKELARERLMIAARCAMALESALQWTVDYARQRQAFGRRCSTTSTSASSWPISRRWPPPPAHSSTAACASTWTASWTRPARPWLLWAAEATRAIDDLLQFHGGYGYMREYPIGRAYTDVRPNRIYGGASEIMRELIARTL